MGQNIMEGARKVLLASWPGMKEWIENYVKGCATCQQNKVLTHKKWMPVYWIPTEENTQPFQQVAMDLIMGLPAI
jgi:hypothetical protein